MRNINSLLLSLLVVHGVAQTTHELHMTGQGFVPDTLYMLPGDSIHLVFDTTGHSMVQVPETSWMQEIASPLIGFSMGFGTPNPGDFHTFVIDSVGTFYYLCEQHTEEKGVIMVGEEFTYINELVLPSLELYPQPAADRIFLGGSVEHSSIQLTDDRGRPIKNYPPVRDAGLDITDVPSGMYFLTLLDRAGVPVALEKVIIFR